MKAYSLSLLKYTFVINLFAGVIFSFTPAKAAQLSTPADTISANKNKTILIGSAAAVTYIGGLTILSQTWYNQNTRTNFHWFNDNAEWKQLDKAGHAWSTFQISRAGVDVLKKSGMPQKRAIVLGSLTGFLLWSPIELLDGYQKAYGASATDLVANAAGSAGVLAQQLAWNEVRITPKFSLRRR